MSNTNRFWFIYKDRYGKCGNVASLLDPQTIYIAKLMPELFKELKVKKCL